MPSDTIFPGQRAGTGTLPEISIPESGRDDVAGGNAAARRPIFSGRFLKQNSVPELAEP
jgi:hypothetical protein